MSYPPFFAGSDITAAGLNMLAPQFQELGANTASLGTTAAQALFTFTGVAPGIYYLTGKVVYVAGASAGAVNISIHAAGAGSVSSMLIVVKNVNLAGSAQSVFAGQLTSLGAVFTSQTMTSTANYEFDYGGILVVNVGGGFSVDVAQTVAADTFTTQADSYGVLIQQA